jgi:tetratricopeptide (TPR) repeat protein
LDKGLKDQARVALERAVLLSPENLHAQRLLGQLYVEVGENRLAQKALGQVLQHNPEDSEIALLLRSIAVAPGSAASGEECLDLEEADVIEELTEVLEEPYETVTESAVAESVTAPPAASFVPENFEITDFPEFSEFAEFTEVPEVSEVPEVPEVPEIFEVVETTEVQGAPEPARNPLTTATLAELYVSQGFLDRAIAIYLELLVADPANHAFRLRCTELKAVQERQKEAAFTPAPEAGNGSPVSPEKSSAPQRTVDAELSRWLENIRRRRDGV